MIPKTDKRSKEVLLHLNLSIEDTLVPLPLVRNATAASILWTNLRNKYQASEVGWSLYFKNLLFSTKLQEGGSLPTYLFQLEDLCEQLSATKKPVDDEDMVPLMM